MADILGLGLSHFPGPLVPVERWPGMLQRWVRMGRVTPELFADRTRWPEELRREWGADEGLSAARVHGDRLRAGYTALRERIDAFAPDIVVIFGDDQFENYKRDCIPACAVAILDEAVCRPFRGGEIPFGAPDNAWGVDPDREYRIPCHKEGALGLTRALIEGGLPVGYSLELRHPAGLAHSFANTVLFLDPGLEGFPFPIIPVHINCYGNQLLTTSASTVGEGSTLVAPPAPSPKTCFEIGRAAARHFRASPWRVCIIGSSSWSHASLTPKHGRLYPDIPADRVLLQSLREGEFRHWDALDADALDEAGQHELLNWIALAGAMTEVDQDVEIVDFVETYAFNSSKCFAVFEPGHSAAA